MCLCVYIWSPPGEHIFNITYVTFIYIYIYLNIKQNNNTWDLSSSIINPYQKIQVVSFGRNFWRVSLRPPQTAFFCSNLHGDMRLWAHSAGLLVLVAESVTAKKKAETARAPREIGFLGQWFGCFRKWWVFPPNHPFLIGFSIINYKPSILGYPYFWKHPFVAICIIWFFP